MLRRISQTTLGPESSILVVRTDRLGDVILTLPVVSLLRAHLPHAQLTMLLRRYTGDIVQGNTDLDEILWYDDGQRPVGFFTMLGRLRRKHFDAAIVARPRLRLALLLACAGIPVRVGTGFRYYSVLFTHRVMEHRRFAAKHEAEYNLGLLKPLGIPLDTAGLRFPIRVAPAERAAMEARLEALGADSSRQRVVLHPGSGGSARDWPAAHFAELARRLQQRGELQVFVTGTLGERGLAADIVRKAGPPAVDLAGQCTVRELAAVLAGAVLFISNSTGPLHLAAALGIPVLGFYPSIPAMSARRWGPYTPRAVVLEAPVLPHCPVCSGAGTGQCLCMESISVDRALEAAQRLMEHPEQQLRHTVTNV